MTAPLGGYGDPTVSWDKSLRYVSYALASHLGCEEARICLGELWRWVLSEELTVFEMKGVEFLMGGSTHQPCIFFRDKARTAVSFHP